MKKSDKKKDIKSINNTNKKELKKKDQQNKQDKKIEELLKSNEKYLNNWKKIEANFLNYKKEENIRLKSHIGYQQEKIALDLINILDNILLAESYIPDDFKKNKWVLGMIQIKKQIDKLLKNYNIEEIKSVGEMVDFKFHEVLQEVETKEKKNGIIITEIQKGYIIGDKVIRATKVIIVK